MNSLTRPPGPRPTAERPIAVTGATGSQGSVGGVERHTGIPHFERKRQIEETLLALGVPATFVRPTFFMDNFARYMAPTAENGTLVLRLPLPATVPLQMIAVSDVAAGAVAVLLDPSRVPSGAIELAGDELTGQQVASAFGQRRGLPSRYEELPADMLDEDMRAMFEWFATPPAYQADLTATRQLIPEAMTFTRWLETVE